MGKTSEFVNHFLAHYVSDYYDPAKAHEYYLKNRELKGRRAVSGLKSEKQKQAWAYAKDKITTEKKDLVKETGNEFKADIKNIRDEAHNRREKLSGLLKDLLAKATLLRQHDATVISQEQKKQSERIAATAKKQLERLSKQHSRELERISKETTAKLAALPPIPKGISAEKRAELSAKRSEEVAKIRGTATKERDSLSSAVNAERKTISETADKERKAISEKTSSKREALSKWSTADKTKHRERVGSEREAVATELKATVDRGREGFKKSIEDIKAKYETKLDTEYAAIKNNV